MQVQKRQPESHTTQGMSFLLQRCATPLLGAQHSSFQTHNWSDAEYSPCWLIWHSQIQLKLTSTKCSFHFPISLAPQKACLCKTATLNCSSYSTYCCICSGEGNDKEGSVEPTTFELLQSLLVTRGYFGEEQQRSNLLNKVFCL